MGAADLDGAPNCGAGLPYSLVCDEVIGLCILGLGGPCQPSWNHKITLRHFETNLRKLGDNLEIT